MGEARKALRDKNKNKEDEDDILWTENAESAYQGVVKHRGCHKFTCQHCPAPIDLEYCVKCTDCRKVFCWQCDFEFHSSSPFCHRSVHYKPSDRWNYSRKLLPTDFIGVNGAVETKGIW